MANGQRRRQGLADRNKRKLAPPFGAREWGFCREAVAEVPILGLGAVVRRSDREALGAWSGAFARTLYFGFCGFTPQRFGERRHVALAL